MLLGSLDSISNDLVGLVEKVKPNVLHIKVHGRKGGADGSGLLISKDEIYYIITNEHVVQDARSIDIYDCDNEVYEGTIAGIDKLTDLAVLTNPLFSNIKYVPQNFADSDTLRLGEIVLSLGNPYGFQWSISLGIISGLNRSLPNRLKRIMHDIIQTDAAVNPGSSGGPLVDIVGRVVGINSAIVMGAQGMSFAIASNTVEKITNLIIEEGEVVRGFLGVIGETVMVPTSLGLPNKKALRITGIFNSSPAFNNLKYEDLLFKINDIDIVYSDDIYKVLNKTTIGKEVELSVIRNMKIETVTCTPTKLEI